MFQPGTALSIVNEVKKYKLSIVALQKFSWSDQKTIDINNTTVLFSKCKERQQFGVGFTVHKNVIRTIKDSK